MKKGSIPGVFVRKGEGCVCKPNQVACDRDFWHYHFTWRGEQIRRASPVNTQNGAMRARINALDRIAQGLDPLADDANYSVRQACDAYLEECAKKPSLIQMRYYSAALIAAFGSRPVAQIGEIDLRKLRRALEATGKSPQTVNKYFSWFRAACNFARGEGRVRTTFWDNCNRQARSRIFADEPDIEVRVPDTSDLDAVLQHLNPRFHAPTRLAVMTGMRRGEVIGLRWGEVKGNWIALPADRTKASKARQIPLTREARELLPPRPKTAEDQDLVWGMDALIRFPAAWRYAREKAGLPNLRFHDLRHAFASNFLEKTGDVVALREIAGWASVSMADRYTHAKRDRQMEAMRRAQQKEGLGL